MKQGKKTNKILILVLSFMMLFGSTTTAFVFSGSNTDKTTEKSTKAAKTTESVLEENKDTSKKQSKSFSVPGNGEVKDSVTDDSSKEFLTITTKNNNTFYIVIDRSATTENVYMLSQIDENDLKEFLDDAKEDSVAIAKPSVVLDEKQDQVTTEQKVEEKAKKEKTEKNTTKGMALIFLLALGSVAGYYYFKMYKPKKNEEDDSENQGMEISDGLKTVSEDEE